MALDSLFEESRRIRDLGDHGEYGEMARNLSLGAVGATGTAVVAGHSGAEQVWKEDTAPSGR